MAAVAEVGSRRIPARYVQFYRDGCGSECASHYLDDHSLLLGAIPELFPDRHQPFILGGPASRT